MKKILSALIALFLTAGAVYATEEKDEIYYKRQIQNQRLTYNESGMAAAITKGDKVVLEAFIKAGFSPNATLCGTPMLILAIYKNKPDCAKVLLDNGADPNTTVPAMYVTARSTNALVYAIKKNQSDTVKYLTEHNVDVNSRLHGLLPLDYAIKAKQTKIVETLLISGAKPDAKTLKLVENSKDEYLKDLFNN